MQFHRPANKTDAFADITALMKSPLSRTAVLRGRYIAGSLAAAGSVAFLLVGGGAAEAHTSTTAKPKKTASAPAAAPKPSSVSTYTIRKGDTLIGIAAKNKISVNALKDANGIPNVHRIYAGQKLVIPAKAAPAPSTQQKRGIVPTDLPKNSDRFKLHPTFNKAAADYGVPADLLKAMAWNESGWQNSVTSSVGAVGIGQLMPDTVTFINGSLVKRPLNPRVPEQNIRMSAAFLKYLVTQTNGDYRTALAAYYQGLRSVRERGWYDDTKQYVNTVYALKKNYF